MNNKTVLITGASSGIGLTLSREYAKPGYSIAMTGLEPLGHDFSKMLTTEFDVKTFFREIDLKNHESMNAFAKESEEKLGTISVLVNNAGIQHVEVFESFPTAKWNDILAVNLSAVFHMCQALWPAMKHQGFGRIINISSIHGLRASEFKSAYVASKHGVIGLTKVLALEGAPFGITANAICPGYVKTPLVEKQIEDQMRLHGLTKEKVISDVLLKKQAVKDFVPAELIAETCLLLSSENAKLMTGSAIPIDGAWTSQ
jgi:3-hydroxybutyrate dehydrogenase